jgi:hypothetical protein
MKTGQYVEEGRVQWNNLKWRGQDSKGTRKEKGGIP